MDVRGAARRRNSARRNEPSADAFAAGARTAWALDACDAGFVWPWWLERQVRPQHRAFVPAGDLDVVDNVTGRSWVTLATASSGPLAQVDPAGALQPIGARWSLDWAIGAEDRWHVPAADPTVRQRLVANAAVVETLCKVPSGDAIARTYAVNVGEDAVVFEIQNDSPVPFVAVFSIRPTHALGVGSVSSVRWAHPFVMIDDVPAVFFERKASRWATADAPHDALAAVIAGGARDDDPQPIMSDVGLATACVLVPVPHRATVRAVVFARAGKRDRPSAPTTIPSGGQVAHGWETHAGFAARIELPDTRLRALYDSSVLAVLGATGGGFASPVGREGSFGVAEEAAVVRALATVGLSDRARDILRDRGDESLLHSWFRLEPASIERNTAIFEAFGAYFQASGDVALFDDLCGSVVKAAHWSERARARTVGHGAVDEEATRRSGRALRAIARALRACDQPDAAEDLDAFAARFELDLVEPAAGAPDAAPAGGERSPVVSTRAGVDVAATVRAATRDALAGDEFAFERIEWLLRLNASVSRLATFAHPVLLAGSAGSGDDPAVHAACLELVRALVVDDSNETQLRLLPTVPPTWFGQSLDVHDLPTRHGTLSFALRWHATRPALLWELTSNAASGAAMGCTIMAPGLDPQWSTNAPEGEALLAAPARAEEVTVVAQPNTDHVPMTTVEPRKRIPLVPSTAADDEAVVGPGDSFA